MGECGAAFTIWVQVGDVVKAVCYEGANVLGTLGVGATVEVKVDHFDGTTHFTAPAGYVKVLH